MKTTIEETTEETTKMNEPKCENVENCAETTEVIDANHIHNRWQSLWQNRRKILAVAVMMVLGVLILIGLFDIMFEMNLLQETGERFQEIKDDNNGLKIIDIIIESLILSVGIMSLWLIFIECIAILRDRPFLTTTRIHLLLIALFIFLELLIVLTELDFLFYVFCFLLIVGFIMEIILCIYEGIKHVIKPIIKLCKDDYSSKQKLKISTRASFYAFSYIIGLIIGFFFLFMIILAITDPLFAKVDDYGDVYYDYGPGGLGNFGMILFFCGLPIFLILSTFSMNIFHNEIIKTTSAIQQSR